MIDNGVHDAKRLAELQALPLERKVQITQARIIEFYKKLDGNVAVSFSGGKDSTVLLHLARLAFPDIRAVFVNTGLEYPEIQKFSNEKQNVDVLYPKITFFNVLSQRGYPLVSKEAAKTIEYARKNKNKDYYWIKRITGNVFYEDSGKKSIYCFDKWLELAEELPVKISSVCCDYMKKKTMHEYQKQYGFKPIVATMAEESRFRMTSWIRNGCNAFGDNARSMPMGFWTEQDVLKFIKVSGIEIASVYGDIVYEDEDGNQYDNLIDDTGHKLKCTGCSRTGCIYCGFGFHLEKGETRFQRLARTHPRQYEYCMGGGEWAENPDYDATMDMSKDAFGWKPWNPKKIWIPNKKGLGLKKVFQMANELYGNNIYRFE